VEEMEAKEFQEEGAVGKEETGKPRSWLTHASSEG
jgi:hypothetical protein